MWKRSILYYNINYNKLRASDYFTSTIKKNGKDICKVYGSYLSFIEFNDVRYWDVRENIPIKSFPIDPPLLKSSSLYRQDSIYLEQSKYINNINIIIS